MIVSFNFLFRWKVLVEMCLYCSDVCLYCLWMIHHLLNSDSLVFSLRPVYKPNPVLKFNGKPPFSAQQNVCSKSKGIFVSFLTISSASPLCVFASSPCFTWHKFMFMFMLCHCPKRLSHVAPPSSACCMCQVATQVIPLLRCCCCDEWVVKRVISDA
jgi:hypothetical protein